MVGEFSVKIIIDIYDNRVEIIRGIDLLPWALHEENEFFERSNNPKTPKTRFESPLPIYGKIENREILERVIMEIEEMR